MKTTSKDHSTAITQNEDVQKKFNKLLAEFLSELPTRTRHIPATIHLSVEKGDDWWRFVANIEADVDGAKTAATLSGLYNCEVCGQEKCAQPGICDDCLAPPTEFEINHWGDDDPAPLVI